MLGVFLLGRRPRLARVCLILGLGSLWLLSTPVVCDALAAMAEHYPPLDLRSAAGAQAIVILGGGGERALAPEYGGPAAEPLLLERLSYGAYIARKTGLPILVTGFRTEAAAMQRHAAAQFRHRSAVGRRGFLRHLRERRQFRPPSQGGRHPAHHSGDALHSYVALGA